MFDREMRYLAVSRRFAADYRLPQEAQLIGRSHYETFPDIPQRWRDIHARVLTGEELSQEEDLFTHQGRTDWVRCIEKRYVRKDGGIVWASLSVGSVRKTDGGVDYFVSIVEDITDRKRAEARLAERNAQLDLAGKIARIGSFMFDDSTKRLQLSPGCAAIYGLPEGTLEISREDWRSRVHPDDLPSLDAVARRAFTNGERQVRLEFRIFCHGQVRWIELRVLDPQRSWETSTKDRSQDRRCH